MTAEKIFTIEETARILKVSTRTIFRMIERGEFSRVIKFGNPAKPTVRIPAESIQALGIRVTYDESSD